MQVSDKEKEVIVKYGNLFSNTGGNDPLELILRNDCDLFSNPIVAALQVAIQAQAALIIKLEKEGLLKEVA